MGWLNRCGVRTIYFDYNATTPLDPDVREAMEPFGGEIYGNPSSVHHVGRRARALLDEARDQVADLWRCKPSEVVFTSGGTESNNLAIFGTARKLRSKGKHLITSPTEHHATRASATSRRLTARSYNVQLIAWDTPMLGGLSQHLPYWSAVEPSTTRPPRTRARPSRQTSGMSGVTRTPSRVR